jgi:LacI family transcriptional regulator
MGKAKINDVAKLAGVSIKTVSRVINREANVSNKTRERVLAVVETLQYQPSQSARELAGNRSYMVGVLYDHLSPGYLINVQQGILRTCKEFHYGLILNPMSYKKTNLEDTFRAWLRHSRVDGVVLTPPFGSDQRIINVLENNNMPAVTISEKPVSLLPSVTVDEISAARELTRHLVDHGHTRIAFVKGEEEHQSTKLRLNGFYEEMKSNDLAVDPSLIVSGDFSYEGSLEAVMSLFDHSTPPSAIFAANDDMAAAVIAVAHRRGFRVPDEIAVVGFDNSPIACQVWPTISTVDQPVQAMAALACEKLIELIKSPSGDAAENDKNCQIMMPYTLHVRASSDKAMFVADR